MRQHRYFRKAIAGSLAVLLWVAFLSGCDFNEPMGVQNTNFEATQSFSFDVRVEGQSQLSLEGIDGPITVTGAPEAQSIRIWGERVVGSSSQEDAEAHLSDLEVEVTSSRDDIRVRTLQPKDSRGRKYKVIYHLRVPQALHAALQNVNGEVAVDSLAGDAGIDLTNGNVRLTDMSGNARVHVVNGQIVARMRLPQEGTCDLSTVNGQIVLDIPQETSARFSASVTNGNIQLSGLVLHEMVSAKNSVSGRLGDGDGEIRLSAVNGQIVARGF